MGRVRAVTVALAVISSGLSFVYVASAADVSSTMPVPPVVRTNLCSDRGALGEIVSRFAWAERTQWHRGFILRTIKNPRPSGHPYLEPGLVLRDYCMADSTMSDGREYPVFYTIEHGLGFAGVGQYVDFCVAGLDPWHIHDGVCRTVR